MPGEYLDPVVAVLGGDSAAYTAMLAEAEARMEAFVAATTAQVAELEARLAAVGSGGAGESAAAVAAAEAGAVGGGGAAAAAAAEEEAAAARITAAEQEIAAAAEEAAAAKAAADAQMAEETAALTEEILAEIERINAGEATIASQAEVTAAAYAESMAAMRAETAELATSMEAADAKAAASTEALGTKMTTSAAASTALVSKEAAKMALAATAIGVGVGGIAVKMAGDFEQATNRLVTAAGESEQNIGMVRDGITDMAGQVGFTAQQLAQAMYTVDSASFHGADSLTILKAASQGAKIEQADLGTTVDAVTTSLVDYHLGADQAATVMSKLVTAVGEGKTNLQELAGSLHSVTPLAANLGITLDEVTAAVATMTVHGMSADQATQNLADTIRHLANPTQTMVSEMGQLGLNAQNLSKQLSDPNVGLHGVLDQIYTTIMHDMGPAGEVLLNTFKQSASAGQDLNSMLAAMPPQLKGVAEQLSNGTLDTAAYNKEIKNMPDNLYALGKQFETLHEKSTGFNDALKAGSPAAQTFEAALAKVMGDSTGLNTALMLGGENADTFARNIEAVSQATADSQGNVKNWSDVANTLNQKLADVEASLSGLAVKIGNDLLPAVKSGADGLTSFLGYLDKDKGAADLLAGSLATLATVGVVTLGLKAGGAVGNVLGFSGAVSGLAGIGYTGIALGIGAVVTQMDKLETAKDKLSADGGLVVATPESIQSATDRWNGLSAAIGGVFNTIRLGIQGTSGFKDKLNDFEADVSNTFGKKLADDIKIGMPQAVAAGDSVAKAIIDTFKSNNFKLNGESTVNDFSGGMRDAVGAAIDAAASITGSVKSAYELFDPSPEGKQVAESFGDGIKTGRQAVDAAGEEGLKSLLTILGSGNALSADAGHQTGVSFVNGVQSTLPQVSGSANQIVSHIDGPLGILTSSAYGSGISIGSNLANGMAAATAHVAAAAAGLAATVRSHLPSSPAKTGPLSGRGSPDILGRNISTMIASGVLDGRRNVARAMAAVLSPPAPTPVGSEAAVFASSFGQYAGVGGGGVTVNVYLQPQGSILAQNDLQQAVQDVVLKYAGRNSNPGWTPRYA